MTFKNIWLCLGDDLNRMIAPLGDPQACTPNLTRLANRALVCTAASTASPACSSSRTAMLGGQAPTRTRLYNNQGGWPDVYPLNARLSFVGRLRDAGWDTMQFGKIGHHNDPADWCYMMDLAAERYEPISLAVQNGSLNRNFDFGPTPAGQGLLTDQLQTDALCSTIHVGAEKHLWALGLHRPHSPFVVPQEFWDMIPDPVSPPPGIKGTFNPYDDSCLAGLPPAAIQRIIGPNRKVPKAVYDTNEQQVYWRSYRAAVAYMDHLVGQVLDKLEATGLLDSTLIVFASDNGEQLGEKQSGRKFALWEKAVGVPLMIAGPGIVPRYVDDPVSLLDLYPTLAEIFGLTPPHPLDGESLVPLFDGGSLSRQATISSWALKQGDGIATRVRTATHSLIVYHWTNPVQLELYDLTVDPHEHENLAAISPRPPETQALLDGLLALLPATMAPPIVGIGDDE